MRDAHVDVHYGDAVVAACRDAALEAQLFAFPAGEWNKTRETWAALSDQMLAAHVGRDAAVIALGGGVVGDVAGFVAATYLRGIPYVQGPTPPLARIDSSIGGQTALGVPTGKNLVGAVPQPRPAGMAEAVKHGAIADPAYFAFLEREHGAVTAQEPGALDRVVQRSVEIKAHVVAADERERGRRAILNFGHTVGHAIEATAGFALLHGEAGAIGLGDQARLPQALGTAPTGPTRPIPPPLGRHTFPPHPPHT